ncbi:hypothetical protein NADE_008048 [Nannochloris sp. 'desiccata']|nr:hypothetical protein KSW81_006184 [Chlorella desiccata (nom. nud.)]KAH7619762.1 hypothetical protein NADE_008048 [Chlorella desiccata (nom. nud.)]
MPALKREGKRSRSKEANAESQRRFMERRREQEEVTNQLINTRFEELEISREEQPPPRSQTAVCSIVKDLAVLLAIPQFPVPLPSAPAPPAVPPATEEAMNSVGGAVDLGTTSADTPQGSDADAKETMSSSPAAAAAPTAAAIATDSFGVDTACILQFLPPLSRPFIFSSIEYAPNLVTRTGGTNTASASDIITVVQPLQTAKHFLHHHSNLIEALNKPSTPVFSAVDGSGSANHARIPRLISLHSAMSNLHSLYWHTAQLKPEVSVHAAYAKLPQNTELAVEIASKLVHEFSSEELVEFRKVSRGYQREMNKISVSVESWMERIRACVVPEDTLPFALAAAVSLDLREVVNYTVYLSSILVRNGVK